jgi:predicted nucleic acid-binding protein
MSLKSYLLDASAIIELIARGALAYKLLSVNVNVLDLTVYECYNALWKFIRRGLITLVDGLSLAEEVSRFLKNAHTINVDADSMSKVLKLAVEKGLTVYDALYVYNARERNLVLVTEDEKLMEKAIELGVKSINASGFLADLGFT